MAKKSQKRILRHERGQAGCISGIISIFHFRHGRSTKRLLSDRSHLNKQVVGKCCTWNFDILNASLSSAIFLFYFKVINSLMAFF